MADSVDVVLDYAVAARPLSGQTESGDSYAVIRQRHGLLIAVVDGLGHGYEAGLAAKLAVITLTAQAHLPLLNLVKCCHDALLRTRGVAMGIACLECGSQTMTWLSVGNVAGLLLRANDTGLEREHILMRNGVIGHRLPPLRTATLGLRPGDTLVFATDGIREGFQSDVRPDAHPQETADRILARYGKITDDALVLVGRWRGCPKYSSAVDLPPNGGDERRYESSTAAGLTLEERYQRALTAYVDRMDDETQLIAALEGNRSAQSAFWRIALRAA